MLIRRFAVALAVSLAACGSSPACDDVQSCVSKARVAEAEGRYEDAVAAFGEAMAHFEDSAALHNLRGSAAFKAGLMSEAIADFDRAIELEAGSEPYHWQRGIAHYYANRLEDCINQFDLHRTVNPNDVENSAWHYLCFATVAGIEKARAEFLPVSGDPRVPMRQVAELYRGEGSIGDVMQAAESDGGDSAYFYAHLYLGLYYEAAGDSDSAAAHIRTAVDDYAAGHYMWHVARIHKELKGY